MASHKHRIGIVSFENPPKKIQLRPNRISSLKRIAKESKKSNITHLFFPGSTIDYSFSENIEKEIKQDLKFMSDEFKFCSILFELTAFFSDLNSNHLGLYCFENGKNITDQPIKQIFVTSKDDKEKYSRLWKDTIDGKRTFLIGGLKILVWICGEINFLQNAQSENNKVTGARYSFRPSIAPNKLDYDIFFNPTHEPLKALIGKYKERLIYMSQQKRIAVLSHNVYFYQVQRKGTMFCFQNGEEILTKEMKGEWEDTMYKMEIIQL